MCTVGPVWKTTSAFENIYKKSDRGDSDWTSEAS